MISNRKKSGQPARTNPNSGRGRGNLSQFGLLEMPDFTNIGDDMPDEDDDDDSLEAELHALISGQAPVKVPKKPKQVMDISAIHQMAAECVKDVDEDVSDDNLSGDEELMAELHSIAPEEKQTVRSPSPPAMLPPLVPVRSPPSVPQTRESPVVQKEGSLLEMLTERLASYKEAEAVAKSIGETSKARRYTRGIKSLETLIKEAKAGKHIPEDNIPPPVAIPKHTAPQPRPVQPSPVQPTPPVEKRPVSEESAPPVAPKRTSSIAMVTTSEGSPDLESLQQRRDQYKKAALVAKQSGDLETAKKYVRIAKQFEAVIEAAQCGQPIDLSNMPPPPPVQAGRQATSAPPAMVPSAKPVNEPPMQFPPESDEPEDPKLFDAPPPPSTVLEALEQRLEKFRSTQKAAMAENNDSKARRLNRIVKDYETAVKQYKAGKAVNFEELPAPPGFGPIPTNHIAKEAKPEEKPKIPNRTAPSPAARPTPSGPAQAATTAAKIPAPAPAPKKLANRSPSTLLDKQLNFLLERQKLFKSAALESKQKGDIQQAKEYLRMCKGFDPMIEATKSGLPIDATSIPTPPQLQSDYVVVEASQCKPDDWEDMTKQENFRTLERDLTRQMDICIRNKDHFLKLGDVSSASKFESHCQDTRKDLLVVQSLWKNGEQIPKFHYETRLFSMVQCHSELADNEVELTVFRGINLPGKPTELDSYVKIEFPFPSETCQTAKTHTVKDTNNPEYKATFKFEINRKSRTLARVFKRHAVKLEVCSKGGFLRSDALLGTAHVKLIDLEKKCTIHDSFDLMDGRKACGGKLEVQICIRDPLLAKQVEEVKEKWLVIGC